MLGPNLGHFGGKEGNLERKCEQNYNIFIPLLQKKSLLHNAWEESFEILNACTEIYALQHRARNIPLSQQSVVQSTVMQCVTHV